MVEISHFENNGKTVFAGTSGVVSTIKADYSSTVIVSIPLNHGLLCIYCHVIDVINANM